MHLHSRKVGILIFPDVEVLDFCGPYEVFAATRLDEARQAAPFAVHLVGESEGTIMARGGMRVLPDLTIADCPPLHVLVVPGGQGVRAELHNSTLLAWIAARGQAVETLTSVCTGSMLLGKVGLLNGRSATTHWTTLDWMAESYPETKVIRDQHVVEDGHILTSAGISAGIDMALRVVDRYYGEAVARATARHMEYPFPDDNTRRVKLSS
jgi:transcriptional regulator GlxA family with amidase domain